MRQKSSSYSANRTNGKIGQVLINRCNPHGQSPVKLLYIRIMREVITSCCDFNDQNNMLQQICSSVRDSIWYLLSELD